MSSRKRSARPPPAPGFCWFCGRPGDSAVPQELAVLHTTEPVLVAGKEQRLEYHAACAAYASGLARKGGSGAVVSPTKLQAGDLASEWRRGAALACAECGQPGATLGCRGIQQCNRQWHFPCAREAAQRPTPDVVFSTNVLECACRKSFAEGRPSHAPAIKAQVEEPAGTWFETVGGWRGSGHAAALLAAAAVARPAPAQQLPPLRRHGRLKRTASKRASQPLPLAPPPLALPSLQAPLLQAQVGQPQVQQQLQVEEVWLDDAGNVTEPPQQQQAQQQVQQQAQQQQQQVQQQQQQAQVLVPRPWPPQQEGSSGAVPPTLLANFESDEEEPLVLPGPAAGQGASQPWLPGAGSLPPPSSPPSPAHAVSGYTVPGHTWEHTGCIAGPVPLRPGEIQAREAREVQGADSDARRQRPPPSCLSPRPRLGWLGTVTAHLVVLGRFCHLTAPAPHPLQPPPPTLTHTQTPGAGPCPAARPGAPLPPCHTKL